MTPWQSLWQVRIPLAAPLILAGVRTALVQLIATAVVAAYAAGGLALETREDHGEWTTLVVRRG